MRAALALLVSLAGTPLVMGGSQFPPQVTPSMLDGQNGFVGTTGYRVGDVGDVNDDGVNDFFVYTGEYRIVFGKPGLGATGALDFGSLAAADGFELTANDPSDVVCRAAGDVNDDGVEDLVIGVQSGPPAGPGRAFVVFGDASIGASGAVDLESLDGSDGFVIEAVGLQDLCGSDVAGGGDFNHDGVDDILIGAAWAGDFREGAAYVVFGGEDVGATGSVSLIAALNGSDGFAMYGEVGTDFLGMSVDFVGDVSGDGVDDLVIGASQGDLPSERDAGEAFVVFGGPGVGSAGVVDVHSLDGSDGFVFSGVNENGYVGRSVSAAGDLNDDGHADVVISALLNGGSFFNIGACFVLFGGPDVGVTGVLTPDDLDGSNGFVIDGLDNDDYFGNDIASVGDFNGDGVSDVLIAAWQAELGTGGGNLGECYMIYGESGIGSSGSFSLSSLSGPNGFHIGGANLQDECGSSVAGVGDVNGDGLDDALIAADGAGECYMLFGRAVSTNPADLDGGGVVGTGDLGVLLAAWGTAGGPADLDGDGVVGSGDLGILLAAWGE